MLLLPQVGYMKTFLKVLAVTLSSFWLIGVLGSEGNEAAVMSSESYDPYAYVCGGVTDSSPSYERLQCNLAKANGITEEVAQEREENYKREQYKQQIERVEHVCERKAALEGISYRKCYRYYKGIARERLLN